MEPLCKLLIAQSGASLTDTWPGHLGRLRATVSNHPRYIYLYQGNEHNSLACTNQTDILGDHSLLCFHDGNPHRRRTLWHDASYRVWGAMLKSVGFSVRIEPSNALLSNSGKRPDLIIHDNSASSSQTFIDFITCVVAKSPNPSRGASLPGAAADAGANEKIDRWRELVYAQGDSFIPIAQEDGGCLNQAALDLFGEAARRAGGSSGERQAFRVFWRQRIAVANAKGVATTIRHRTPICSGVHWPIQPHHFSNLDFCPPARPTNTDSQNPRAAGVTTTLTADG